MKPLKIYIVSKIQYNFETTKNLPFGNGKGDYIQVLIVGKYYPDQCSKDELSYDIEEVYELAATSTPSFPIVHCNLTGAFKVAEYNDDMFAKDVADAAEKQIMYLLNGGGQLPERVVDKDLLKEASNVMMLPHEGHIVSFIKGAIS